MIYPQDIIKSLIRTEKATVQYEPASKYLFLVKNNANRLEIKEAIEKIYNVKVTKVNTYHCKGKLKRVRYQLGRTPKLKKAIVTLKKDQKIEVA